MSSAASTASAAQALTDANQPDQPTIAPVTGAGKAVDGADGNTMNRSENQTADELAGEVPAELPAEVLRDRLTRANAEAARYRVRAKEAEQKLGQAKTVEEYEAAVADFAAKNAALERQVLVNTVARQHALPDDLAEVLKGDTAEELEAHAQVLKKYAGNTDLAGPGGEPESLSGGLDPTDDDAFDPVAESRKARARRF